MMYRASFAPAASVDASWARVRVRGRRSRSAHARGVLAMIAFLVLSGLITVASANAAEPPRWALAATTNPTNLAPESTDGQLVVSATNVGGGSSDGSTITIQDALPARLTATSATGYDTYHSGRAENGEGSAAMTCEASPTPTCTYSGAVDPGDILTMTIHVSVSAGAPTSETSESTVSGGGAATVTTSTGVSIDSAPAAFGPAAGSLFAATSTAQAGAHANVTTSFALNTKESNEAAGYPKDIHFDLPPASWARRSRFRAVRSARSSKSSQIPTHARQTR